jgi:hypothetical protein
LIWIYCKSTRLNCLDYFVYFMTLMRPALVSDKIGSGD